MQKQSKCTIYENIFSKKPFHITIADALDRIKTGKSKEKVEKIRNEIDKERRNDLKKMLPSVCFSGIFIKDRKDEFLEEHSGFIILDFDHIEEIDTLKSELGGLDYIYSFWTSPSGDGVKALVKIADSSKHREHYRALKEQLPNLDIVNINQSRVCFESYDPEIYINENAVVFTKIIVEEKTPVKVQVTDNTYIIRNILKWLSNKGDAFVSGERNTFIFKFGSACCRFGIDISECKSFSNLEFFSNDSTFSTSEGNKAIESAYRSNNKLFGSAKFEKDILIDSTSKKEVELSSDIPEDGKPKDVIFGEDIIDDFLNLYDNGFEKVTGIGVLDVDLHFKPKRKEITLLSGYANLGKSTFFKWYFLMRALKYNEKFCFFAPEDAPAHEFYFDCVEMLLGCNILPSNAKIRPSREIVVKAFEFVSQHFYFVYPKELAPTPEYIKERFLQMVITQKVDGVIIDPFNQLSNDYTKSGNRSDKYLETFLSDYSKFAKDNNVFAFIVAHPKNPKKNPKTNNFDCPEVFDIADGAMWANKMDNILIYHRPDSWSNPDSSLCEFHSKKIRRQKVVGKKGSFSFQYEKQERRFFFDGLDPMAETIKENKMPFYVAPSLPVIIEPNINGFEAEKEAVNYDEIPF